MASNIPHPLRQHNLLTREYGSGGVLSFARQLGARLPQPLRRAAQVACINIAMKFVEDVPICRADMFPGLFPEDLAQAELEVLDTLGWQLGRPLGAEPSIVGRKRRFLG